MIGINNQVSSRGSARVKVLGPPIVATILVGVFPYLGYEVLLYFFGENKVMYPVLSEGLDLSSFYFGIVCLFIGLIVYSVFVKKREFRFRWARYMLVPILLYGWLIYNLFSPPRMLVSLYVLIARKDANRVERLLKLGVDPNQVFSEDMNDKGYTPLMFAIRNDNDEVVRLLLRYGANVDAKNKYGKTALDLAREKKIEPLVTLLQKR